jgi:hypothetical protein
MFCIVQEEMLTCPPRMVAFGEGPVATESSLFCKFFVKKP